MSRLGLGQAPSASDRNKLDQADAKARRDTDQFIKQQVRDQEKLAKTINSQVEEMKKLQKIQKELAKDSEEYFKTQQKLSQLEKQTSMNRAQMQAKDSAISNALDQREGMGIGGLGRLRQAYQNGGIGGAMTAGGRMGSQYLRGLGPGALAGTVLGAAGSALAIHSQIGLDIGMAPSVASQNRGQAASTYNENLQNIFSGNGYEDVFYAKENKKAREDAKKAVDAKRKSDKEGIFSQFLQGAGGGAVAGGAAGSFFGGIGAGPGAIIGGIIGGIASLFKNRETILGNMGVGPYKDTLESKYDVFESDTFKRNKEANKQLDPIKKLAFEDFQKNMMQNLNFQRSTGINDQQMFDFNDQITRSGFTRSMGREASQGILAAGGSTRGALGNASLSLQMQRDYNLTNANQVLGRLSGTMGSAAASEKSLISVLAAGMKEGLDKSEFAEENRKFTQAISETIYRTGANDPATAAMIANREASFLASKTTRGIEAAQSASQFVSGIEKQGSGIGSVLEMGGMLSNKNLSKLNPVSMSAIQNMDMNQIMSLSPAEKSSLTRQAGFNSFDEFIQAVAPNKEMKLAGQLPQLYESVQKSKKFNEANKMGPLTKEQQAEGEDAEAGVKLALKAGFGLDNASADSVYKEMMDTGKFDIASIKKMSEKVQSSAGAPTGRAADTVIGSAASNEAAVNTLQKNFIPQIDSAASSVGKFADEINKSLETIRKLGEAGKQGDMVEELKKLNSNISSRFADQLGKDSNGKPLVQDQGSPRRE
jgi:hypothetical protein